MIQHKIPVKKILAIILLLNGLFLAGLLAHSIYRDVQLEKQYPGDLRNRVVGARLQKDGILPYFYHWNLDTIAGRQVSRYIDPANFVLQKDSPSNITASPFFHEMLFPICDLPQRTISRIWMWLEYFFLAGIIGMACGLTPDNRKRLLLVNVGILFTVTEAWKTLILSGQLYFFIAFLMSCIITGLMHKKKSGVWIAGICAAMLILVKPTSIVIFIPFILQFKKHALFLVAAFSGLALYGLFVLLTPFENALWKDYARAIPRHVDHHQRAQDQEASAVHGPKLIRLEGFDFAEVRKDSIEYPVSDHSENGNIFVIYRHLTNKKMALNILYALTFFTVIALTGIFYYSLKKYKLCLLQTLLFGFILYMVVEIFSPVYLHQYYTTQWLPLILSGFLLIRNWKSPAFILLVLGLVLNILNTPLIPMRHTLGEICWFAGLLLVSFTFTPTVNQIK